MMATPQMTAAIADPGRRRDLFAKQQPGDQRGDQRHAGLHQQDVGDGRVGERHDEGGRGGGEAERHREAGQAHAAEQLQRAAPAVAHRA